MSARSALRLPEIQRWQNHKCELSKCRIEQMDESVAETIGELVRDMQEFDQDGLFTVPDIRGQHMRDTLMAVSKGGAVKDGRVVEALLHMAGKAVPLRKPNRGPATLIDTKRSTPADLLPLVVMDASGRVRKTYSLMARYRDNLVRLRSSFKDYSNLSVYVWDQGGGKTSFDRNWDVLLEAIKLAIGSKPDEDWLIIHHKTLSKGRFDEALLALLPPAMHPRIHFLH